MIATAIIVFREVLEAALIVGIILAASKGVPYRLPWVMGGIVAGLLGSVTVAGSFEAITEAAAGMGQELLNAAILGLAVIMLGFHIVYMQSHGRQMAADAKALGAAAKAGTVALFPLASAVAFTVLREGSETVLFLYGVISTGEHNVLPMLGGGLLGAGLGIGSGWVIYAGLIRLPVGTFFKFTNGLIALVAAGMAAQAAGFLIQADLAPALGHSLWDTSSILSETSLVGKILHSLVGYEARPAPLQVAVYLCVLAALWVLSATFDPNRRGGGATAGRLGAVVALALCFLFTFISSSHAEFKIRSPDIDEGELEIEHNYSETFDKRPGMGRNISSPVEIGYGVLPFWFVELEGEFSKMAGENWSYDALTFENTFMLTEPGKYWMDFAIFAEYSKARNSIDSDSATIGGLFQKEYLKYVNTLNVYLQKDVGSHPSGADTFIYAWQTRYRLDPLFQPGIEFYGQVEDLRHPGTFNEQQLRVGPMFAGSYNLGEIGGRGKIKYEVGYLFGTTTATERETLRTRLEFELAF